MIKLWLCLVCVALGLPAAAGLAEGAATPRPGPVKEVAPASDANPPLDGNYVLALTSADKKGPEVSVLVAAQKFSVFNSELNIGFSGQLVPQEKDGYLLGYDLVQGNILIAALGQTSTHATVLLHLGDVIQIVKNGNQFYNLRLDRYNAGPAKAAPAPESNH